MNARVFLLVLFTFAFMGVWDADRPAVRLAKTAKPAVPVAVSQPDVTHTEQASVPVILECPAVPGQETLPLDVQTLLVFVASAPWETALQAEVPKPVEPVAAPSESSVIERAVDVIANLMADVVRTETAPVEVVTADEQLEVVVTEIEETTVMTESAPESEALPMVPEPDAKAESVALSQEAAESFIPLPKNLAAGTWQVMTESGEFYRVTIDKSVSKSATEEDGAETVEEEEESFSAITTADGVRWCFIRSFASPQNPGSARQASTEFFGPSPK